MSRKYIHPNVFFLLVDGKLIAWNYKAHEQFQLEKKYFDRLTQIATGDSKTCQLDEELFAGGLIVENYTPVEWCWDELSKIFHIGTQNIPRNQSTHDYTQHIQDYLNFCDAQKSSLPLMNYEREGAKTKLPPPNLESLKNSDFWSVLKSRKTYRSFENKPISVNKVSTILYATFGEIHKDDNEFEDLGLKQVHKRKSSPSAGGMHPSEAYLLCFTIDGLAPGIYHYQAHNHILTNVKLGDFSKELAILLVGQHFSSKLSFGVFITSKLDKCWSKYKHSRGYRNVLLDAGHLSQTFLLTCSALKLHPWLTGAFTDDAVSNVLGINDTNEYPILFVGAGLGDGSSLDAAMLKQIHSKIYQGGE